jgi:phospholipase/lecithinase/hemolysin
MGMKHNGMKAALTAAVALLVAACGGGSDNPAPPPTYARMVSFGDSLSDVGSYRTPGVAANGGGQFTVNDFNPATRPKAGTNWTEQLAHELALPAPCAARTGLLSSGTLAALAAPVTDHAGCTNYAQGGSRVTNPVGPYNAALLQLTPPNPEGQLGALTQPIKDQIAHHLAVAGGKFTDTDLVTVLAGGNDAFMQLATLRAKVAAGANASTEAQAAIAAMSQAGAEMAGLVRDQLLAQGAQRVVVVLVPDIGVSPLGLGLSADQRTLVTQMSLAFNTPLSAGLAGDPRVLLVDAYTASELQALAPAKYGLSNTTVPACDLTKVPSSLLCSAATVLAGQDVSKYWFADSVHPTPYGYQLLARVVSDAMTRAGWLAASGTRPCNAQADGCTLAPLPQ